MTESLPDLPTPRLSLRAVRDDDAPALFAIFSDPEVVRYWSHTAMTDLAEAEALVRSIQEHFAAKTLYEWITVEPSGAVVGTATLAGLDFANRRAEIGFSVLRDRWGRGYATEAASAMIRYAFDELGMERIEADVDPDNLGSLRLLRRLGFVQEGFLPQRYRVGGGVQDTVLLGLLASSWRAESPPASPGVREATVADRVAVADLLAAQMAEHDLPVGRAAIEATIDGLFVRPDRGAILVADEGEGPVGVAYLSFMWSVEHGGASAWLEELYVRPAARGRGLGAQLLDAAMARASSEGASAIDLEVDAAHARAEGLYRRAGFEGLSRGRWQRRL